MKFEGKNVGFDSRAIRKTGIQGGAVAGFLLALIVILFKGVSGFAGLPSHLFSTLWPVIIFNGTLAGAATGFICSQYTTILYNPSKPANQTIVRILLFLSGFIISALVQQLSARNALGPPVWNETRQRFSGGLLGEPNFETMATGVIGGVYFLSLALMLSHQMPRQKGALLHSTIRTILPGIVAWSGVYFIYALLTGTGLVPIYYIPWKSAAIFIVDFPHPERVVLYVIFCFLFTLIMIKTLQWNYQTATPNGSWKDRAFLEKVVELVEQQMGDPNFGPEQLAKALSISKGHLNRKLNDLVQTNTTKFIVKTRLEKAAVLLQQDYDSVSRIAYYVGFNNLSYFNKCFKQQFDLTPSEYKKQTNNYRL